MKRCPQCEFIYEDDQSHCDMDGTRLTRDSHALPKLQALTTTSKTEKSKARSRVVAALATLVLVGVMAMVYYVSIRQAPQTTSIAISPTVEAAPPNPQGSPAGTTETTTGTQAEGTEKHPGEQPAENSSRPANESKTKPSKPDTARTIKAASQTRGATQSSGTTPKSEEKDDTKVEKALKKTGRFFKKALPF